MIEKEIPKKKIAILGAGPSGLFMFKRLIEGKEKNISITIFEKRKKLGSGMPYSAEGANKEHMTNVSDNEIPTIFTPIREWVSTAPESLLAQFNINPQNFNDYKVLPRLFFGEYLSAQFDLLLKAAKLKGIETIIYQKNAVTDIIDLPNENKVNIEVDGEEQLAFDKVIICTGHSWPKNSEGKIPGYYDSPYPPSKLVQHLDHPVAIKGSSLTAIDAIKTLAYTNGEFHIDENDCYSYQLNADSPNFKLVLHSRNGFLPAIRFHLENTHLRNNTVLTAEEIAEHRTQNDSFLSLDFIFEQNFKRIIQQKDPKFYEDIKSLNLEEFVAFAMKLREELSAFQLFKAEIREAEKSIRRKQSVFWKEMLAVLSFEMNYPAKYFSAEDMQRLQKVLMPLIAIVIAFVPQSSAKELLALHEAGVLDLIAVGDDSTVEPQSQGGIVYHYNNKDGKQITQHFKTFVDSVGQAALNYMDFPFKSLISNQTISPAMVRFREATNGKKLAVEDENKVYKSDTGQYYLKVPGIAINDCFQIVDGYNAFNNRIYMMAVPYIGGFNPDYSGLDFCEAASAKIIEKIFDGDC